jgi:hypothetical protein
MAALREHYEGVIASARPRELDVATSGHVAS